MNTLPEALEEAAAVVQSAQMLETVQRLVQPGIDLEMRVRVSKDRDGKYKVVTTSATVGTEVTIRVMKNLSGQAVPPEDFRAFKKRLKGEVPLDPRDPGAWDD